MAKVARNGQVTYGFKNISSEGANIKIIKAPRGSRFGGIRATYKLRKHVVTVMNKHGRKAAKMAKSSAWSPYLSGALTRSIYWERARSKGAGGRLTFGSLVVGVPYGRKQEYSVRQPKRMYLHRAVLSVLPGFQREIRNPRNIESIVLGRGKFR